MISPVASPNRAILFAFFCFSIYWVAAVIFPAHLLRDIFNGLAFGAAVVTVWTWTPSALKAMRENAEGGEWQLILAIYLMWIVLAAQRIYVITYNWLDRPDYLTNSAISGFWPYSFMVSGLLFLNASRIQNKEIGNRGVITLVIAVAIGSLIAGIMIGASISSDF